MKFFKIVFWSILTGVALYYVAGIWMNNSKRTDAKVNEKRKKSGNYKNYGTIYKSSKKKISDIQSKHNEKLSKELFQ
ncbi:hypothetical protein KAI19_01685 [bacterium]|nr:hypothetical protein [bacterium]